MIATLQNMLTTQAAAHKLGVSARRVRGMIADGDLPSETVGAVHLIPSGDVEELIEKRKKQAPRGYTVTIEQAAKKMGIPVSQVQNLVRAQKIKSVKREGVVYLHPVTVRHYSEA